ncbi:MAG: glucosamine-6-phosphate deaminase, partial [Phycisphaerales bacterium]
MSTTSAARSDSGTDHVTRRRERIPVRIHRNARAASRALAEEIATLVRARAAEGRNCVLGLATGSTPTTLYEELVR